MKKEIQNKLNTGKDYPSLYVQIKDIYKSKILKNELKFGDRLPGELDLMEEFNVSRITARQALLELEKDGLVERGRGKGTFVCWKPGIEEELSHIMSFTEEMKSRNRVPGTISRSVQKVIVDEEVSNSFNMPKGQEMYCVKRVRTADDVRMVYFVSYFPLSTNLPLDPDQYEESIYKMFDFSGIGMPTHIEEKISAMMPDKEICEALNIPVTQPVLLRERISYNSKGELIEYSHIYYRGDLYKYSISTSK